MIFDSAQDLVRWRCLTDTILPATGEDRILVLSDSSSKAQRGKPDLAISGSS